MTGPNEAQAFSLPRPGDHAGFEALMVEHRNFLRRSIEGGMDSRLRSVLEPEDVLQDVMITAFRSIDSADFPNPTAFRKRLGVLVKNRLIDLNRRHFGTMRRDPGAKSLDETLTGSGTGDGKRLGQRIAGANLTPSAVASRRESTEALESVLAQIPLHHRQIILMVHVERLSTREIAARTGKTQVATRKAVSRALGSCRRVLLQGAGR